MGDVRLLLDGAFDAPVSNERRTGLQSRRRVAAAASAAALVGAVLAAAAVWRVTRTETVARYPVRVDVSTPPTGRIERLAVTLSPDGRSLAFIAPDRGENRLWVHSFEDAQSRVVAPSDPVRFSPLWSPDSQSLAFLSSGRIKKVALAGGAVQTIAELKTYAGGCWLSDDVVIIATNNGFVRIPASGGVPVQLTQIDAARGENFHAGASPLPDGHHFLYVRGSRDAKNAGIYIGSVDAAPERQDLTRLLAVPSHVVFAAAPEGGQGHLIFAQEGVMMAQPFDPVRLELVGEPLRVPGTDRVQFTDVFPAVSASANGAIAYRRAGSEVAALVFVGRDGKEAGSIAAALDRAEHPRASPDGRSLALIVARELWKYDLEGRPPVKLTFDGALSPVWSPDGQRLVYEAGGTLRAVPADGSGKPEQVAPKGHFHPHSFTPDSREIVAVQLTEAGSNVSLVRLALRPDAVPERIGQGGVSAALSPDGRWLAYTDETTGAQEIWVRPYPGPGAPIRVSPRGGAEPVWARSGRELFYLQDKLMMAVTIDTANGFNFKPAVELFETSHARSNQPPSYDVMPDGRFVLLKPTDEVQQPVTVILNWTEMLKSPAPRVH
jgi:hypothetical protein